MRIGCTDCGYVSEDDHCFCEDCYKNGFCYHMDCLDIYHEEADEVCEGCKDRKKARESRLNQPITQGVNNK